MAEKVLPRSGLRGDSQPDGPATAHAGGIVPVPLASRRLRPSCDERLGTEVSVRRARRRVRGWVRVTTATAVVLVVSLWAAWPAGAGDPLGEIKEFTAGLTPNSGPNRITEGPDGNLWFTERANPARIGRITP